MFEKIREEFFQYRIKIIDRLTSFLKTIKRPQFQFVNRVVNTLRYLLPIKKIIQLPNPL